MFLLIDNYDSFTYNLYQYFSELGADVRYHDPYVADFVVDRTPLKAEADLEAGIADADLVILLQPHDSITGAEALTRAALILDTRGVLEGDNIERL